MKKIIFAVAILATGVMGCKKQNSNPNDLDILSDQSSNSKISSKEGTFIFENEKHMYDEMMKINEMSCDMRLSFEKKLGITSLATIQKRINDAEVKHQDEDFNDINPNLSVKDYENLGIFYQNTEIYNEYLEKGVIEKIIYEDKSQAFELSVKNAAFHNILNAKGELFVGENKYVFSGTTMKIFDQSGKEILMTTITPKMNHEFDFEKGTGWVTDPSKGSSYRYRANVKFVSGYTIGTLSNTFYWEARAEKKVLGNWNTRNNYNPIYGFSGSWSYDYWIQYNGAGYGVVRDGLTDPLPYSSSPLPDSPYNISNLNTNATMRYLHPHGFYTLPAGANYKFFENTRLYNHAFVAKFSGGSSGSNLTLY